jgi:hypothetical protein
MFFNTPYAFQCYSLLQSLLVLWQYHHLIHSVACFIPFSASSCETELVGHRCCSCFQETLSLWAYSFKIKLLMSSSAFSCCFELAMKALSLISA